VLLILEIILSDIKTAMSSSAMSLIIKATARMADLALVGILVSVAAVKSISANLGLVYCSPDRIHPLFLTSSSCFVGYR
jgi:hypothetical protein